MNAFSICGSSTMALRKRRRASSFYFANLGGGVHGGPNLSTLGEICQWFQADNQGRGGQDEPIWGCTLQGRVCNAVLDGKMAANVVGLWSTGIDPVAREHQVSGRGTDMA
jgi:hypothetical protein